MIISVFTDASVVDDKGGYAFYIGCKAGKLQKAGRLRHRTRDTVVAELYCVANALHTLKHCKFSPMTAVWLFCDQKQVITVLAGETRNFRNPEHRKIITEIQFLMMEICQREGRSIRDVDKMFHLNHILAHTRGKDIKSRINNWCDVNAYKYAKMKPLKPITNEK